MPRRRHSRRHRYSSRSSAYCGSSSESGESEQQKHQHSRHSHRSPSSKRSSKHRDSSNDSSVYFSESDQSKGRYSRDSTSECERDQERGYDMSSVEENAISTNLRKQNSEEYPEGEREYDISSEEEKQSSTNLNMQNPEEYAEGITIEKKNPKKRIMFLDEEFCDNAISQKASVGEMECLNIEFGKSEIPSCTEEQHSHEEIELHVVEGQELSRSNSSSHSILKSSQNLLSTQSKAGSPESGNTSVEVLRLKEEVEKLREELQKIRNAPTDMMTINKKKLFELIDEKNTKDASGLENVIAHFVNKGQEMGNQITRLMDKLQKKSEAEEKNKDVKSELCQKIRRIEDNLVASSRNTKIENDTMHDLHQRIAAIERNQDTLRLSMANRTPVHYQNPGTLLVQRHPFIHHHTHQLSYPPAFVYDCGQSWQNTKPLTVRTEPVCILPGHHDHASEQVFQKENDISKLCSTLETAVHLVKKMANIK